jgi:hypothetical protein
MAKSIRLHSGNRRYIYNGSEGHTFERIAVTQETKVERRILTYMSDENRNQPAHNPNEENRWPNGTPLTVNKDGTPEGNEPDKEHSIGPDDGRG